jgi:hypothetical protein
VRVLGIDVGGTKAVRVLAGGEGHALAEAGGVGPTHVG